MRIVVAEDERALARAIVKIFEKNNYSAEAVYNGKELVEYLESGSYDVAVVDVMMPVMDGLTAVKTLREKGIGTPVLMLTAKSETEDKVAGLDSGANYYLTKPFDTRELLAAVRAITRQRADLDSTLCFGNLTLDRASAILSTDKGSIRLANKEFQIMEMLMSNPSHIISSERLLEKVWGFECEAEINVVWVYISNLRKKLTALQSNVVIKACRNSGYSLETV